MKSLLVEDNAADARLIREMLKDLPALPFELQHVTRLDAALQRLRQEPFDVVLLDLGLPDSQGMETLTAMQKASGSLPIVVLTGRDDERFALQTMRAGAQDYLVKGRFDSQLLVRSVRYAVERKRAEEEVRRLNAELEQRVAERTAALNVVARKFATMFDTTSDGVWIHNLEGQIQEVNDAYCRMSGYSREELVGMCISQLEVNESGEEILQHIRKLLEKGGHDRFESRHRRKDGSIFDVDITALHLKIDGDQIAIFVRDITERKQAEEALLLSEQLAAARLAQLRATLDNLAEAVYVCDAQGKPLLANPAFRQLTGATAETMPQDYLTIADVFPLYELSGKPVEFAARPLSAALRGEVVRARELRFGGQSDGDKIVRYNAAPVRDAEGNIIMAVLSVEDITASKQAEAALIRSEKLASVGRMAATIAHEINNPLAAVMNTIFIARDNADSPEQVRAALEVADEELRRIAHLTRQTLGFYRESIAPANFSVNEVLDSAVDLLKSKIKTKRATIRKQYEAEIEIVGMAGELRQVFSNLIGNSLDAIEEGGTISLSVAPSATETRADCVAVAVTDNGKGIRADALPHIFEPFFTTKEEVGTGLGMWIAKQIVDKHGGSIQLQSSTDGASRGTTISIVLPVNAELSAAKSTRQRSKSKVAAAGRRAS